MTPTFEELIQAGFDAESYVIEGMPMAFTYRGSLVAFDKNDDGFFISTEGKIIKIYEDKKAAPYFKTPAEYVARMKTLMS